MNKESLEEYARKKYPRIFKNKPVFITEEENYITIRPNLDSSPIILSKDVLTII